MKQAIALTNPVEDRLEEYARANRETGEPVMCQPMRLALCGAGPSLREADLSGIDEIWTRPYDAIWACNSALTHLASRGIQATGIGIDQTPGLLAEWIDPPDTTYYLASTCDPALVAHLRLHGRDIRWFHNAVAFEDETDYYCRDWPPGFIVGEGATVVSRVIGLASFMGFRFIDIFGADCALAPGDVAHADGTTVAEAYGPCAIMEGEIDGRKWRTRPDMLMNAVDLVRKTRRFGGRIRLMGDTLAVALLDKPDEFLDEVMRRLQPGEEVPA